MTTAHRVQGLGAKLGGECAAQSMSRLFFRIAATVIRLMPVVRAIARWESRSKCSFSTVAWMSRTLLFFGIERAIRTTVFTVKFLLATWCMTIFAQVDGVTAAAPYGNHARFLSLSGTTWHDTIYQSLLDHYQNLDTLPLSECKPCVARSEQQLPL
jgi:hypothetical protein